MANRLKSRPRYELWNWVEQNAEAVHNTNDAYTAKLASEALGFAVTGSHIVAARNAFGIRRREGVHYG